MLHHTNFIQSLSQLFRKQTLKPHAIPQNHNSAAILKQCNNTIKITRRELSFFTAASPLLLFLDPNAKAELPLQNINSSGQQQEQSEGSPNSDSNRCNDRTPTGRAFLDISIDGQPAGRIIIALNGEASPIGAARFSYLVSGKPGITFRRKEFVRIMPNYVQHGGIRSYGVDAELARREGRDLTNEELVKEWKRSREECKGTKNLGGSVSIIVRDPLKPPPKVKLVARQGKLEIDEEEVGLEPNGTEFTIAIRDSPELDSYALVIGRVVEGMDVVQKIGKVKAVQENTTSPYFRVAKLIGDKRAVVAERGFNRPYFKVVVTNCGLLE